jgi:hypothetical protein
MDHWMLLSDIATAIQILFFSLASRYYAPLLFAPPPHLLPSEADPGG